MKKVLGIITWIINKFVESNVTAIQESKLYRINSLIFDFIEEE